MYLFNEGQCCIEREYQQMFIIVTQLYSRGTQQDLRTFKHLGLKRKTINEDKVDLYLCDHPVHLQVVIMKVFGMVFLSYGS